MSRQAKRRHTVHGTKTGAVLSPDTVVTPESVGAKRISVQEQKAARLQQLETTLSRKQRLKEALEQAERDEAALAAGLIADEALDEVVPVLV